MTNIINLILPWSEETWALRKTQAVEWIQGLIPDADCVLWAVMSHRERGPDCEDVKALRISGNGVLPEGSEAPEYAIGVLDGATPNQAWCIAHSPWVAVSIGQTRGWKMGSGQFERIAKRLWLGQSNAGDFVAIGDPNETWFDRCLAGIAAAADRHGLSWVQDPDEKTIWWLGDAFRWRFSPSPDKSVADIEVRNNTGRGTTLSVESRHGVLQQRTLGDANRVGRMIAGAEGAQRTSIVLRDDNGVELFRSTLPNL